MTIEALHTISRLPPDRGREFFVSCGQPQTVRAACKGIFSPRPLRCGFTLVELLVVIAIIGILVSLLLPGIQACREVARRTQCISQLSQLIVAVHNYEMAHAVYPPGTIEQRGPIQNHAQGYHHNWIIQLLPYLEESAAYNHIDRLVGVYDPKNAPVRVQKIPLLMCPSQPAFGSGYSSYAGVHHDIEAAIDEGNNGVFFLNSRVAYDDVTDGASWTLFLGEKLILQGDLGWASGTRATLRNTGTQPGAMAASGARLDYETSNLSATIGYGSDAQGMGAAGYFAEADGPATGEPGADGAEGVELGGAGLPPVIAPGPTVPVGGFDSAHPAGVIFAFGDGRIDMIMQTIPAQVYQQLGHRADGQLLDKSDL